MVEGSFKEKIREKSKIRIKSRESPSEWLVRVRRVSETLWQETGTYLNFDVIRFSSSENLADYTGKLGVLSFELAVQT